MRLLTPFIIWRVFLSGWGVFKIFKIYEGGPEKICRNRGVVGKILCKNLVSPPSPPCLYLMTGP